MLKNKFADGVNTSVIKTIPTYFIYLHMRIGHNCVFGLEVRTLSA